MVEQSAKMKSEEQSMHGGMKNDFKHFIDQ